MMHIFYSFKFIFSQKNASNKDNIIEVLTKEKKQSLNISIQSISILKSNSKFRCSQK